ncbi:MAG: AraC family transcriptional regulator [Candidatus Cloacimonetes bacterium]|nr:AraC family transcriptional regulator [Candidatus Cloacimonadota bacterium]
MKRFDRERAQVRFSWSRFLLPVTLAAILLVAILYSQFDRISMNMLNNANQDVLDQSDSVMSYIKDFIYSNGMQLLYDEKLVRLRTAIDLTPSEVIRSGRKLDSFGECSSYVHSVYIYNEASGWFFSSSSYPSGSEADFFDREIVEILAKESAEANNQPIYREIPSPYKGEASQNVATYVLRETGSSGALVINVHEKWLDSVLQSFFGSINVLLLNGDGVIVGRNFAVTDNEKAALEQILGQSNASSEPIVVDDWHGKDIFFHDKIGTSGWVFVRHMFWDDLYGELNRVKSFTFIGLFCILLVVSLLALAYAFRFFRPLRKVSDALHRSKLAPDELSVTEYVDRLVDSAVSAQTDRKHFMAVEYLRSLMTGAPSDCSSLKSSFLHYGIEFDPSESISLLVIQNDESSRALVDRIFEKSIAVPDHGRLVCFVPEEIDLKQTSQLFSKAGRWAACENLMPWTGDIKACVQVLDECLFCRLFSQKNGGVITKSIIAGKNSSNEHCDDKRREVIDLVARGAAQGACLLFSKYLQSLSNLRFATVILNLRELCLALGENDVRCLDNALEVPDSHGAVIRLFSNLIEQAVSSRGDRVIDIVQRVKDTIEANYPDMGLCSKSIADDIGLSNVYLGKLFRKGSGHSVSDEINECRIAHAKILLKTSDRVVQDIAACCGFPNVKYFYTLFRKSTGMSPLMWREKDSK